METQWIEIKESEIYNPDIKLHHRHAKKFAIQQKILHQLSQLVLVLKRMESIVTSTQTYNKQYEDFRFLAMIR